LEWKKRGLIFCPSGEPEWMEQFAMLPTPLIRGDGSLRVYLGFCTKENVGRIGYVDVSLENPGQILEVSKAPVLDIGQDGCFDDNGVVPVSICQEDGKVYLYYIGFQLGVKVPYYMFCGLAVSQDGGDTFCRYSKAPILDRAGDEMYARCGVHVMRENKMFKMWYIGSDKEGWTLSNEVKKPLYIMKYIESEDGIHWGRGKEPVVCMGYQNADEHGFGRPYVWKEQGMYKMLYSVRTYSRGYYIGYAESVDGIQWTRKDEEAGIGLSDSGWDSENLSYPYLYHADGKTYMLYNGNGCGKTGFGYAELVTEEN